eukprot:TRINITY_DN7672_c0_g1_i1.p1 TRINITY_DN7672_c0_g1~~TRINITY_DN7672_c0_g1_i1.p1  ORF type:complete len:502 (+),score=72.90 TRINITY_DN7672_c0_g1_i1:133-1638(+)
MFTPAAPEENHIRLHRRSCLCCLVAIVVGAVVSILPFVPQWLRKAVFSVDLYNFDSPSQPFEYGLSFTLWISVCVIFAPFAFFAPGTRRRFAALQDLPDLPGSTTPAGPWGFAPAGSLPPTITAGGGPVTFDVQAARTAASSSGITMPAIAVRAPGSDAPSAGTQVFPVQSPGDGSGVSPGSLLSPSVPQPMQSPTVAAMSVGIAASSNRAGAASTAATSALGMSPGGSLSRSQATPQPGSLPSTLTRTGTLAPLPGQSPAPGMQQAATGQEIALAQQCLRVAMSASDTTIVQRQIATAASALGDHAFLGGTAGATAPEGTGMESASTQLPPSSRPRPMQPTSSPGPGPAFDGPPTSSLLASPLLDGASSASSPSFVIPVGTSTRSRASTAARDVHAHLPGTPSRPSADAVTTRAGTLPQGQRVVLVSDSVPMVSPAHGTDASSTISDGGAVGGADNAGGSCVPLHSPASTTGTSASAASHIASPPPAAGAVGRHALEDAA